jgi:hypothetical protein
MAVPGIGRAGIAKLASEEGGSVNNSYQLIGKYLSLRGTGMGTKEHCDAFWFWLRDKGLHAHRTDIVLSIAEKVNTMIPGIYDECVFTE